MTIFVLNCYLFSVNKMLVNVPSKNCDALMICSRRVKSNASSHARHSQSKSPYQSVTVSFSGQLVKQAAMH